MDNEAKHKGNELSLYAKGRICELFKGTGLKTLSRSYIENRIRWEFQAQHGWNRELDLPVPPRKTIRWQNRIHLARASLVEAGILMPTNPENDRQYVLAASDSIEFDDLIKPCLSGCHPQPL